MTEACERVDVTFSYHIDGLDCTRGECMCLRNVCNYQSIWRIYPRRLACLETFGCEPGLCCVTRADGCWRTEAEREFQCSVASCGGRRGTEPRSSPPVPPPQVVRVAWFFRSSFLHCSISIYHHAMGQTRQHIIISRFFKLECSFLIRHWASHELRKLSFCFVEMLKCIILHCTSCAPSSRN